MDKIALFGGTFDPIHLGHRNCIEYLVKTRTFLKVILIPTSQNPLKIQQKPTSAKNRLKMIDLALTNYSGLIEIDHHEIRKQKPSYTFETLKHLKKKHPFENLHFVMGLDTFLKIDQWKNFSEILKMTNLLIINQPSCSPYLKYENLPKGVQPFVESFKKRTVFLNTGYSIDFLELKTREVSSSLIREKIKRGQSCEKLLDPQVEKYIKEHNVYPSKGQVFHTR